MGRRGAYVLRRTHARVRPARDGAASRGGAPFVERSPGLGDALGFVPTDAARSRRPPGRTCSRSATPRTCPPRRPVPSPTSRQRSSPRTSSASSSARSSRRLRRARQLLHRDRVPKALLIDFNYETEPLPGHYPSALGLPLLRESRLNHLGKLAFQWVYWHALLPGREIRGSGRRCRSRARSTSPFTRRERSTRDDHDADRRRSRRRRRRRLLHEAGAVERGDRPGDRARRTASTS